MFGQSCQCVKDSNKDGSLGFPWGGSVFILILTGLNKLGHSSLFWVAWCFGYIFTYQYSLRVYKTSLSIDILVAITAVADDRCRRPQ